MTRFALLGTLLVCVLCVAIYGISLFFAGARGQLTFHVTDDAGVPLPGVELEVSTFHSWKPGEGFGRDVFRETRGKTDTTGVSTVRFFSQRGDCRYRVLDVSGYYSDQSSGFDFTEAKNGKWHPANPRISIILKPKVKPIGMFAKQVNLAIPSLDRPLGFDLEHGDWVPPYGEGISSDLLITATLDQRSPDNYDYRLLVSFPNRGDGIQTFEAPLPYTGSLLRSPRFAPESNYDSQWIQTRGRRPNEMEKGNFATDGNRNYFFRVRTIMDESGNIKSAYYGKIYGDFMNFAYYLNPTSNDRNMEFDPEHNLIGDLKFGEKVNRP